MLVKKGENTVLERVKKRYTKPKNIFKFIFFFPSELASKTLPLPYQNN